MAIGDVYRLAVEGRLHGQMTINVLHYTINTGEVGDRGNDLVAAFRTHVEPSWLAAVSNEWSLIGYTSQKIRPLPVQAAYQLSTPNVNGSIVQNSLPSSVAVVLTKRTFLAGPRNRGRIYIAGVPINQEIDSKVTGAALNLYSALADVLQATIETGAGIQFEQVLWHQLTGTATDITEMVARDILRNQRRRQVGRGR